MEITKCKHIHFTGIKGVAMTALALCAKDLGIKITGSDTEEIFVTDEILAKAEVSWKVGFGKQNLNPRPDLVITTGAHGGLNNPEVLEAKQLGIDVITYAEALADFARHKKLVSVCGVGGKGSTSSMIATALELAGKDPSFAIGMGDIYPIARSGKYNEDGEYFICEADEYAISPGVNNAPKFSLLNPFITIVTNIEYDHPDIYPTFADTLKVYEEYFAQIPKEGVLIANIDNKNTHQTIKNLPSQKVITYGFSKAANWQIGNLRFKEGETEFTISNTNENKYSIKLQVPGEFNALNATAAFIASAKTGVDENKISKYLESYKGARRRFEKMGVYKGAIFYDDYAHHPSEIFQTLKAAREWYPKNRIIVIFQPHTYSRTKALLNGFAEAFKVADIVGLMDIYASARESKDESVDSRMLANKIKIHNKDTVYLGGREQVLDWFNTSVGDGDLVITMGAGDIFRLYGTLDLKS